MGDVQRPDHLDEVEILARRQKVASLYLARRNQYEIARLLGVSQPTVCLDLAELKREWKESARSDLAELIDREAAELDEMEAAAALEFSKGKQWEWFDRRLAVKTRRAKLLGLDAPSRTDWTSGGRAIGEEWPTLRSTILSLMEPFPEARMALAGLLVGEETGDDS